MESKLQVNDTVRKVLTLDPEDFLSIPEVYGMLSIAMVEALLKETGNIEASDKLVYLNDKQGNQETVCVDVVMLEKKQPEDEEFFLDELLDTLRLQFSTVLDMEDTRDVETRLVYEIRNILADEEMFMKLFAKGMNEEDETSFLSVSDCDELINELYEQVPEIAHHLARMFVEKQPLVPKTFLELSQEVRTYLKHRWKAFPDNRYKANLIEQICSPTPKHTRRTQRSLEDPLLLRLYQQLIFRKSLTPRAKSLK